MAAAVSDAALLAALGAYGLREAPVRSLAHGNINKTYVVESPHRRLILQRLNPIFKPEIHHDMEAVTAHLQSRGMPTPRLVRTVNGALWVELEADHSVWRMQTYMEGVTFARAPRDAICWQAGYLLGRFHACLSDFKAPLVAPRLGVHDTQAHMHALEQALLNHRHHVAYQKILPTAEGILAAVRQVPDLHSLRPWAVHGDPKLSNMIFSAGASDNRALALVDLDTLNRFPVALELGDALRSWCNPHGEDTAASTFHLPYFAASLAGYHNQVGNGLLPEEIELLPQAPLLIALELAARFARDVLEEKYFGWDRSRFAKPWQHHLHRACSQYSLAQSYRCQADAAWATVKGIFGGQRL